MITATAYFWNFLHHPFYFFLPIIIIILIIISIFIISFITNNVIFCTF